MVVRLSESVDAGVGAIKGAVGIICDYALTERGSDVDEITIVVDSVKGVGVCVVKRSVVTMTYTDAGWFWKKAFPLK